MIQLTTRATFTLILAGALCQATNPAIGLVVTNGPFQVNSARVQGNATVFEGNTIETAKAPSQLRLNTGVQVRLASESRAKVYGQRTILEKGTGQLESSGSYQLEARTLRISGAAPHSVARVQLSGGGTVVVAAMAGAVRVTNASGLLVAAMDPGRELSFDPEAGASAPTRLSGCLLQKDNKFIVVDQATNVTMGVEGAGLDKLLGNRVEVSGAVENDILRVASVKQIAKGGCAAVAKKIGAAAGAASAAGAAGAAGAAAGTAGAAAGVAGATVAIVGGVAVAGTVGGLAAAETFSGNESNTSTSR